MLLNPYRFGPSSGSGRGTLTIVLTEVPPGYNPQLAPQSNPWYAGTNFDDGGSDAFDQFGFFKINANGVTSSDINVNGNGAVGDITSQTVVAGGVSFTVQSGWIARTFFAVKVTGDGSTSFSLKASGNLGSDSATTARKVLRTVTVGGQAFEIKYVVSNDGPTEGADTGDPRIVYTYIPANPALNAVGSGDRAWSFTPAVATTDSSISDGVSMESAADAMGVVYVLSWGTEDLATVAGYIESALKVV